MFRTDYAPGETGHVALTNAVNALLNTMPTLVNVMDPQWAGGATGDGSANDTAAVQAALTGAPDGSFVVFPAGKSFSITQVAWSGKTLHLMGYGATIVERSAQTDGIIKATNAPKSTIEGFACQGIETEVSFIAAADTALSTRAFVRVLASADAEVRSLVVTGKTVSVLMETSDYCVVDDIHTIGFGTASTTQTGPPAADVKNHTGTFIKDCDYASVTRIKARSLGSAVLVGSTSEHGTITDVQANNCFDNTVYISSGNYWSVSKVTTHCSAGSLGSGVKTRGSGNSVTGCTVDGHAVGITMTPIDSLPGTGGACTGNTIQNTVQAGIYLAIATSTYLTDVTITGNTLINTVTGASSAAAIQSSGADNVVIEGNVINGCAGTAGAIQLEGPNNGTRVSYTVTRNRITAAATGILLEFVDNSLIEGNVGKTISARFIDMFDCDSNRVAANKMFSSAAATIVRSDSSSTENELLDNSGGVYSLANDGSGNALNYVRHRGTGAPTINAKAGSTYSRSDGGAITSTYVKESSTGSTNWVAK